MTKCFVADLRGKMVIGASGRLFGEVSDLELETDGWQTVGIIVRVQSSAVTELGINKPFWSSAYLMIPIDHVVAASDTLILNSSLEQIASLLGTARADDEARG